MGSKSGKTKLKWLEKEIEAARQCWGQRLSSSLEELLRSIVNQTGLSVRSREVQLLQGTLYVNHAGLLRLARTNRCAGIETEVLETLSRPEERRWVVRASVYKSARSQHPFLGLGDADPTNIGSLVRGAELRVAETRAVNRALRKAYAIALCSAEEVGGLAERTLASESSNREVTPQQERPPISSVEAGPPISVGDRLKIILREHGLDPLQVLRYAFQYLEISDLKAASAEELERFADHLEQFAISNRTWLLANLSRAAKGTDSEESHPQTLEAA